MDSCQGIPGGRCCFVFDGASVLHSFMPNINRAQKRNGKPFKKKLDYREHTVTLAQKLQPENVRRNLFPDSLPIFH